MSSNDRAIPDIVDPEEYQRALARIRGIRSPDRTKSGDWELQRALEASKAEVERNIRDSRDPYEGLTENEILQIVLAESAAEVTTINVAGVDTNALASSSRPNKSNPISLDSNDEDDKHKTSSSRTSHAQSQYRPISFANRPSLSKSSKVLISSDEDDSDMVPARPPPSRKALQNNGRGEVVPSKGKQSDVISLESSDEEGENYIIKASETAGEADSDADSDKTVEEEENDDIISAAQAQSIRTGKTISPQRSTDQEQRKLDNQPTSPQPAKPILNALPSRAELERERLARAKQFRAAKRGRQSSSPEPVRSSSAPVSDNDESLHEEKGKGEQPDVKRRRLNDVTGDGVASGSNSNIGKGNTLSGMRPQPSPQSFSQTGSPASSNRSRNDKGEMFWDGEVRSTYIGIAEGIPGRKVFSIDEIVGDKSQLSLVIACSYCWEEPFVARIFPDPLTCPFIKICQPVKLHGHDGGPFFVSRAMIDAGLDFGRQGTMVCMPKMGQYGSMHMKFTLLFYKSGRMRLVIASANLFEHDWSMIENVAFVQDLPAIEPDQHLPSVPQHHIPLMFRRLFQRNFRVEEALNTLIKQHPNGAGIPLTPSKNFQSLGKWDWSRVKAKMVVSIDGYHEGTAVEDVGLTRLSKIVREEKWMPRSNEELVAEFQSSSLHRFTESWMKTFHHCFRGLSPTQIIAQPKHKNTGQWPPMKILYPSLRTVDESIMGRPGGGTMFCGPTHYRVDTAGMFYDSNSKAGKVLQHTKMIIATFQPRPNILAGSSSVPSASISSSQHSTKNQSTISRRRWKEFEPIPLSLDSGEEAGGWWYMGSHNLSTAAWGTLSWKKGISDVKLHCKNYEMGLIFPLPRGEEEHRIAANRVAQWSTPARKYGSGDVPWMQREHGDAGGGEDGGE